ncbi:excinuclease ABC subunit UvrA [Nocardioides marmoribigeumensis]|uniref:UvrABC system protein A n=1 Tax=Nocardioides marmoribigeumensis TaxID=433649 RepID=A0ABU2BRU3_9ACTN|nr:excinuclease ABC subunit UvrA [Nocardioides marmoribigeumensis]MDR7361367.1 excinuclease ABC subunit A [Nocardioides marmoribigeumensis]
MTITPIDPYVRVRGASEHNLRNVDVDLPRDSMVVFTGVSGSGKSSLAFGTVYAEAQRRYFESVAPYARRLLQQVGAPHVQEITGLPPAVALQQRRGAATSRSSVGTITTLSNLLRILYSRAGDYPRGADHLAAEAFSPNTVAGACPRCHGLGVVHDVTEELLVPDPSLSIREGAIAAWPGAWQGANLRSIVMGLDIDVDKPWERLRKKDRDWLLFTDEQPSVWIEPEEGRVDHAYYGKFWSARKHVMHVLSDSKSERMRERALKFVVDAPCSQCHGSGLRPEALAVTFAGLSIAELNQQSFTRLIELLRPFTELPEETNEVAVRICTDLVARVQVLLDLGLGYLSLGRSSTTLSPGEAQRLRIATQLRSGLFGVVYVLDEPSAGLHPADAEPLLDVLDRLKAAGNSLFVVEHDMDVVRRADWVVDIGPGAGEAGGHVLYSGPVEGLEDVAGSVTSDHLFGRAEPVVHELREPQGWLELRDVTRHNLRELSVDVPLCVLTAVTGVSGSGKSSLVSVLSEDPEAVDSFDRLVLVDQRPIGRTPRSNLATYTGLFDAVRKVYAATDAARKRRYGAGRFSFNVAEGRCETCDGEGFVSVELLFLPGTYAPCPTCHGARYNDETLEITYRGKNIADVLGLSVDEAAEFLADVPAAARSLQTLREVGLGYLRLGQPATELSGGEAQRIKLATELQRAHRGHALYLLDEPTSGLHPADTALLMRQLHQLVDAGNTVVLVEHDLDVVAGADWVIDLGPGGGDAGGQVVASGPPAEIATADGSVTAPYLARRLAQV